MASRAPSTFRMDPIAFWAHSGTVGVYIEKQANPSGQSLDRPSPRHPTVSRSVAMGVRGRACVPGDERIGYEVEAGENQREGCEEVGKPMERVPWARVCVPQSCGSMRASDKVLGVARSVGRRRRESAPTLRSSLAARAHVRPSPGAVHYSEKSRNEHDADL
jgi:hypothetical protein